MMMRKYVYMLVISLGLVAVVGFTTKQLACKKCTKSSIEAGLQQEQIGSDKIIGLGLLQVLTADTLTSDLHVANIQLEEGSYLHWQTMPGGRVIIVTEGEGFYQSKGKDVVRIKKGDTIETFPGLYHWVGATPESGLEFISVTSKKSDALIKWHETVTEKEYRAAIDLAEAS
ncbi:cupin domain-containing protein [Sphingobacterium psychroaquaticum]|uniref:cupin domain-containing protein n=1 Tax=Sphingobacterium psychroaquaticum TaxID=561061 RepID=UPI00106B5EAE|nr:cupin domain-containing protein [Sphingobacterium psychroaquaticum]QBQ41041.1 cupin domain-containing protein [Sphingobacterium psychroaquaticum]